MKKSRFASVHGGLLARKGQAAPAVPSAIPYISYTDAPPSSQPDDQTNETGFGRRDIKLWTNEPLIASKAPVKPEPQSVSESKTESCRPNGKVKRLNQPDEAKANLESDRSDSASRFKISVHLTAEQKRRVRTIAVQLDWSHQKILLSALDNYLDNLCTREMKGCACLNKRLEAE